MEVTSGKKVVTAAGTAEALGSIDILGGLRVKALSTNTGLVYIGNDGAGDVSDANGFQLSAGQEAIFAYVGNLGALMLDAAVNGEGVTWLRLEA